MASGSATVQHDETERLKSLQQYEILDTLPDPPSMRSRAWRLRSAMHRTRSFLLWTGRESGSSHPLVSQLARSAVRGHPVSLSYSTASRCLSPMPWRISALRRRASCSPMACNAASYAAAPLLSPSGTILGTIAVCSVEPDAFSRSSLDCFRFLPAKSSPAWKLYVTGHVQENVVRLRQRSERALTGERNFVAAVLNTISALVLVFDTAAVSCVSIAPAKWSPDIALPTSPDAPFRKSFSRPRSARSPCACLERVRSGNENQSFEIDWRSKAGGIRALPGPQRR